MSNERTKLPASTQVMIAVTHAYQEYPGEPPAHVIAAAAIRAAANAGMIGPDEQEGSRPDDYDKGWNKALKHILAIANKLDSPTTGDR